MKKFLVLLVLMVFMVGCTDHTKYGPCVGLNGDKNPQKVYHYSGWNIAMGIIFAELIVPPIVVVLDGLQCPVSDK